MTKANPVLVEITRGDFVESRHRGACVVVNAAGEVLHAWGDVDRRVYPRSSLKPIQALPLIETGAADHFGLEAEDIALACASHNSEPMQVDRVRALLQRAGLSVEDLECGPCEALSMDVTKDMSRDGILSGREHNNCSGKHAGFLCTALYMDEPTKNYIQPDHPVQGRVTNAIETMIGEALSVAPCSSDGCGIPVFAIPLVALARGMARMTADDLGGVRGPAAKRILKAMSMHSEFVAGTKRFDTRLMQACKGAIVSKGGAEGVHIAIIEDRKIAIALKVDDGTIRASELAMGAVLDGLGLIPDEARGSVADLIEDPIDTTLGQRIGEVRKGPGLVF